MNFKLTLDSNVDLQCNGGAIASTVVSLALAHVSSTPLRRCDWQFKTIMATKEVGVDLNRLCELAVCAGILRCCFW